MNLVSAHLRASTNEQAAPAEAPLERNRVPEGLSAQHTEFDESARSIRSKLQQVREQQAFLAPLRPRLAEHAAKLVQLAGWQ